MFGNGALYRRAAAIRGFALALAAGRWGRPRGGARSGRAKKGRPQKEELQRGREGDSIRTAPVWQAHVRHAAVQEVRSWCDLSVCRDWSMVVQGLQNGVGQGAPSLVVGARHELGRQLEGAARGWIGVRWEASIPRLAVVAQAGQPVVVAAAALETAAIYRA